MAGAVGDGAFAEAVSGEGSAFAGSFVSVAAGAGGALLSDAAGAAGGGVAGAVCAAQRTAAQANTSAILTFNLISTDSLPVVTNVSSCRRVGIILAVMAVRVPAGSYFLAKTDPETYPFRQLERDGRTVWDGVKNPQALRAIREMKAGDRVFIYHSMGEAAIVGMADVVGDGRPDPKDPKLAVADFQAAGPIEPPVTLREIKESGLFADWALVRQSRLSTMSAPAVFVEWMRKQRPASRI